jgi:hypothetical protein
MIARIAGPILVRTALVAVPLPAAEVGARSILVLDQSEANAPFYYQIFSGLRSAVNAEAGSDTTLYSENLDLNRFDGAACEENLRQQLDLSGSSLPPHREIRFREPDLWENCRWQSISVFALLLIQAALIDPVAGAPEAQRCRAGSPATDLGTQTERGAVFRLSLPLSIS